MLKVPVEKQCWHAKITCPLIGIDLEEAYKFKDTFYSFHLRTSVVTIKVNLATSLANPHDLVPRKR